MFDSFIKGILNHQLFKFQDSNASQICAELYTLYNSGPKFFYCFFSSDFMYREILTDFSSSSFLLYIYSDAIFIWDVFIYWPNILDILFLYRSRHVFRTVCYLLRRRARVLTIDFFYI